MPRGIPKSGKRKPRKKKPGVSYSKIKTVPTSHKGMKLKQRGIGIQGKSALTNKAGQAKTKANRASARAARLKKKGYKTNKVVVPAYKGYSKLQKKKAVSYASRVKKAPNF